MRYARGNVSIMQLNLVQLSLPKFIPCCICKGSYIFFYFLFKSIRHILTFDSY